MADPVVHITNGVPDSGTGNITTLGQTLVDGANATHGALADVAVAAGASGTFSGKLRAISRDIGALIALLPTALGAGGGLKVDGSGTALPVSGTVTANAGTNLNTSALALEAGGNLAATAGGVGTAADAVVAAGAAGSLSAKLRAISRDLVANIVLAAGTNIIGLVKVSDGTNTAAVKAASTAPVATDPALVVSISPNSVNANVQGGAPVTVGAVIPTATANGATSSRVKAAATTNATNLKASAGQIYSIDVFNNAAYVVYLKLYNKAGAPTVGTDTPIWTIPIANGGGFSREFPRGKTFSTGISYAITKLEADSDTTVVVADDLTGTIDWI